MMRDVWTYFRQVLPGYLLIVQMEEDRWTYVSAIGGNTTQTNIPPRNYEPDEKVFYGHYRLMQKAYNAHLQSLREVGQR